MLASSSLLQLCQLLSQETGIVLRVVSIQGGGGGGVGGGVLTCIRYICAACPAPKRMIFERSENGYRQEPWYRF